MCGIIATTGANCLGDALRQYEAQQSRGSEGFGFIALRQGKKVAFERATNGRSIRALMLSVEDLKPDTVLFHHRYPTSTINVESAAHPLPISKKGWAHRYWILHNGVVRGESKYEIARDGYHPKSTVEEISYYRAGGRVYEKVEDTSVNDSEYLGYYIASYLEGKRKDIPMDGSIACFMVQEHKKTGACEVFVMRNGQNPIKIQRGGKKGHRAFMMASESRDGAMLEPHMIWKLDQRTRTLSIHREVHIGKVSTVSSHYGGTGYTGANTASSYATPMGYARPYVPLTPSLQGNDGILDASLPIIGQERERLQRELDKAMTELEECAALVKDYDDASPETKLWLANLQKAVEDLEDKLDDMDAPLSHSVLVT